MKYITTTLLLLVLTYDLGILASPKTGSLETNNFRSNLETKNFRSAPRYGHRKPRSDQNPGQIEVMIMQMSQQVTQLTASVTSLKYDVEHLQVQSAQLQQKNAGLIQQANGLQLLNSALSLKLDTATQTMQEQNATIQNLQAEFARLKSDNDKVVGLQNSSLENLRKDLGGFHVEVDDLGSKFNQTSVTLLDHTNKIINLGGSMALVENDVINIKSDSSSIRTELATIQSAQINVNIRLTQQSDRINVIQQNVTSVDARVAQNEQNAAKLETWKSYVTYDVAALNATQTQLAKSLHDVEQSGRSTIRDITHLNGGLTDLEQRFDYSTKSVLFYVSLTQNQEWPQPPPPHAIALDDVKVNVGQSYDATSGNFTASVLGDYFFSAMAKEVGTSGSPVVQLMVDNDQLSISDANHPILEATLRLRAGQTVWLRSYFATRFARGMYFTGFLIRPVLTSD